MIPGLYQEGYTQNRELSWLRFDERCLDEARDASVPLLERLKFLAIFSSNLDEFFAVRVGTLTQMRRIDKRQIDNKSGLTPDEQIRRIRSKADKLCRKREDTYKDLKKALMGQGVNDLDYSALSKADAQWLRKYFHASVEPLIGAQIVDPYHPLPTLMSGVIYCAAVINFHGEAALSVLPIPARLPHVVRLPDDGSGAVRFVHMEDVILNNMAYVFRGARIVESWKFFLIRNADVEVDDDPFDGALDYREKMTDMLRKRRKSRPVRLEISRQPDSTIRRMLFDKLDMEEGIVYVSGMPLDRRYLYEVGSLLPAEKTAALSYAPYTPKLTPQFDYSRPLFDQVLAHDVVLMYPYHSMEPFLQFVKEAAYDPETVSIKITIYRLARRARLVDYLAMAAENGKEVDVIIELKARFDEQNNIDYSEKLMDAGCHVYYGFEDYKVHSKICLRTRVHDGQVQQAALIATGNFNENTARQYSDIAYFTARKNITADAVRFFQNMMVGRLDGYYRTLLVSPHTLKKKVLALIEREIGKKEQGRIILKLNSITDEEIIAKLKEASCAGVRIDMIVRGITCLIPELAGKTENIHIRSIVGRYLEHSRIYVFGSGRSEKIYLSSADFMTRNTEHRVEIAVPIADAAVRARLHAFLALQFSDNTKARVVAADGRYHRVHDDQPPLSAQDEMMKGTTSSPQSMPRDAVQARRGTIFTTEYHPAQARKKRSRPAGRKKVKPAVSE